MDQHTNHHEIPAANRGTTWEIDPKQSDVLVTVRHREEHVIRVRLSLVGGVLVFDEIRPSLEAVRVEIDAGSLETGNRQRDEHLRSGDFLDAGDYPSIYFASRQVQPMEEHQFLATGDLRIRDVIVQVAVRVFFEGISEAANGEQVAAFQGNACLSRHDFGLVWDRDPHTSGWFADVDLSIALHIRATRVD